MRTSPPWTRLPKLRSNPVRKRWSLRWASALEPHSQSELRQKGHVMPKVLFVSPHLDDAVFSCAARILREVDGGTDVTVATVFSHARPRSPMRREYVARQEEDRIALGLLGAKPLWLGLLDAPCRSPFYNSFQRIVLETAPGDGEFVQVVRTRIAR